MFFVDNLNYTVNYFKTNVILESAYYSISFNILKTITIPCKYILLVT